MDLLIVLSGIFCCKSTENITIDHSLLAKDCQKRKFFHESQKITHCNEFCNAMNYTM